MEIRYGFHAADLFDWPEAYEDADGYDQERSAALYAELVKKELKVWYPGATVDVIYDFGTSGVLGFSLQTAVDGETDHEEVGFVEHIAGQVYQDFAWCVEKR